MSFIKPITEQEATGETARIYEQLRPNFKNKVPNWFQSQGARPDVMQAEMDLFGAVFSDGALPRRLKEQVGLVVADINHSSYCVALHSDILHSFNVPRAVARALAVDYPSAPATEPEMALFRFADKLTRQPDSIEQGDADELRRHGWNDAQILEMVLAVALMNYANRISTGLGLTVDF
jgi:4-carboxymuconolactone decarboxylase